MAGCPRLPDSLGYGRIEYAYHLMARAAGIEMTECRLHQEGGRSHFMTRRFDRDALGRKIHMQTFGALRHFDYNSAGAYGYEQVMQTSRALVWTSAGALAPTDADGCRVRSRVRRRPYDDAPLPRLAAQCRGEDPVDTSVRRLLAGADRDRQRRLIRRQLRPQPRNASTASPNGSVARPAAGDRAVANSRSHSTS
ncbi:MAG: HipA domain-containing protein [Gammaproteobacteria bacterium]|nr:HipA domain-containing protein [Gammaproteobacteria bacterium]